MVAHWFWVPGVVSSSLTFPTFLVGLCHEGIEQQGRLAGVRGLYLVVALGYTSLYLGWGVMHPPSLVAVSRFES